MWILRLREPRTWAGLSFLLLIIVGILFLGLDRQITYHRRTIFLMPWGTEPGQAGLAPGNDGMGYGPRSFHGGAGRIVVADTFNARIQIFSEDGSLLAVHRLDGWEGGGDHPVSAFALPDGEEGAVPASGEPEGPRSEQQESPPAYSLRAGQPWINDVAVDSRGHMYLADGAGARILHLDADGRWMQVIDLADDPASDEGEPADGEGSPEREGEDGPEASGPAWLLEQLETDGDGLLYLAHTYLSEDLLARRLIKVDPVMGRFERLASAAMSEGTGVVPDSSSPLPIPANSFSLLGRDGLLVESRGPDPFTRLVRLYEGGRRLTRDWTVRYPYPIVGARLLGTDPAGRPYLLINGGRAQGAVLVLTDGDGEQVITPEWEDGYAANVYARVGSGGHIYVAVPTEAGWRLDVWEARSRWVLGLLSRQQR